MAFPKGVQRFKSFARKASAQKFARKYKKPGYGASIKRTKDKWGTSYMVRYYRKK